MACVIAFIADHVLPEAPLPDAAFAARDANIAPKFVFWKRSCKPALDQPPSRREIAILRGQGPDRMDMIGQNDERVDRKRMVSPRRDHRLARERNVIDEQGLPPLLQVHREEEAPARHNGATIVWHVRQDSTFDPLVFGL